MGMDCFVALILAMTSRMQKSGDADFAATRPALPGFRH